MAVASTQLAAALASALGDRRGGLRKQYLKAIAECDDAWDAVEGALMSKFYVTAAEALVVFRAAYARKLAAFNAQRNAD